MDSCTHQSPSWKDSGVEQGSRQTRSLGPSRAHCTGLESRNPSFTRVALFHAPTTSKCSLEKRSDPRSPRCAVGMAAVALRLCTARSPTPSRGPPLHLASSPRLVKVDRGGAGVNCCVLPLPLRHGGTRHHSAHGSGGGSGGAMRPTRHARMLGELADSLSGIRRGRRTRSSAAAGYPEIPTLSAWRSKRWKMMPIRLLVTLMTLDLGARGRDGNTNPAPGLSNVSERRVPQNI